MKLIRAAADNERIGVTNFYWRDMRIAEVRYIRQYNWQMQRYADEYVVNFIGEPISQIEGFMSMRGYNSPLAAYDYVVNTLVLNFEHLDDIYDAGYLIGADDDDD